MQKLIQPINRAVISASYLNTQYHTKFRFPHYGVDMYGQSTIYAQGFGIVSAFGFDDLYGNFVQVVYPDCHVIYDGSEAVHTLVVNYFHLDSFGSIERGMFTTKDTKLGVIGQTGTYATGIHLHVEMRIFGEDKARMVSAFKSTKFKENKSARWINPLNATFCKITHPDSQTRSFADRIYTSEYDRLNVHEVE